MKIELNKLRDVIDKLCTQEQLQIMHILQKHGYEFEETETGMSINMNSIDEKALGEMKDFINAADIERRKKDVFKDTQSKKFMANSETNKEEEFLTKYPIKVYTPLQKRIKKCLNELKKTHSKYQRFTDESGNNNENKDGEGGYNEDEENREEEHEEQEMIGLEESMNDLNFVETELPESGIIDVDFSNQMDYDIATDNNEPDDFTVHSEGDLSALSVNDSSAIDTDSPNYCIDTVNSTLEDRVVFYRKVLTTFGIHFANENEQSSEPAPERKEGKSKRRKTTTGK